MPQKKNNSKQIKVSAERNGDKPQNAYFLSLELENVRCFGERQMIDFSDRKRKPIQWTIILGDNGTGKTTLLQNLIVMLPTPDIQDNMGVFIPNVSSSISEINRMVNKFEPKSYKVNPFVQAIIPELYMDDFPKRQEVENFLDKEARNIEFTSEDRKLIRQYLLGYINDNVIQMQTTLYEFFANLENYLRTNLVKFIEIQTNKTISEVKKKAKIDRSQKRLTLGDLFSLYGYVIESTDIENKSLSENWVELVDIRNQVVHGNWNFEKRWKEHLKAFFIHLPRLHRLESLVNPIRITKKDANLSQYKKNSFVEARYSIQSSLNSLGRKLSLSVVMEENKKTLLKVFFETFNINLLGYGASRKAGETSISEQNEESAYSTLFDETSLLINPEECLIRSNYESLLESEFQKKRKQKLNKIIDILIKILPDINEIRFGEKTLPHRNNSQPIVEFHTPYGWVESKDLSLGYRTSMAWMVDFASRMFDRYPESENPLAEPAVVLIDEIDLHLHPKWQRELLDYLSNLFPNTQFIVTTHSPLIVQSAVARDANIVVCRREGDHVVIEQIDETIKNMRVDQILTGEYFNLPTARPKETENLLKEKEELLSKPKLTKKDEKRLAELEEEIGFLPVSENHEDNEAMEIIRNAAEWLKTQAK